MAELGGELGWTGTARHGMEDDSSLRLNSLMGNGVLCVVSITRSK